MCLAPRQGIRGGLVTLGREKAPITDPGVARVLSLGFRELGSIAPMTLKPWTNFQFISRTGDHDHCDLNTRGS